MPQINKQKKIHETTTGTLPGRFLGWNYFTASSQKPLIPNNTEVFKLYLETHGSYNEALSGEAERDRFLLNDLKVEATGTVTPWLSYAYRQVLCYRNEWVRANGFGSYIENAWVNVRLSDKFSVTAGKQDAAWEASNTMNIPIRYTITAI